MTSNLHFTQPIEDFGGSVTIGEDPEEVEHKLRVAARNDDPAIIVHRLGGRKIVIPTRLIGLIEQRQ